MGGRVFFLVGGGFSVGRWWFLAGCVAVVLGYV